MVQTPSWKAVVIHSPHSGRAAQFAQALRYLQQAPIQIAGVLSIAELDGLPRQGPYWREQGVNLVIAAGGDGLVGGVITHIAESKLPLAILPLGTANDIARSMHIPQDLQQAVETIVHGTIQTCDIGIAQPGEQTPHKTSGQQGVPMQKQVSPQQHGFFAHALTVGLNVQFARLATNVATRQHYGHLTYPIAALEVLRKHSALETMLVIKGLAQGERGQRQATPALIEETVTLHTRALEVALINAPIFGGQWELRIPNATLQDHLLDIIIVEDIDLISLNASIAQLFNRQTPAAITYSRWHSQHWSLPAAELAGLPGIHHLQAREVTISTTIDPQDATLDGEVRGQTPLHARIADESLQVVVPRMSRYGRI